MNLKDISECIWAFGIFDETLLRCNPDEESTWFNCHFDRLDAMFKMIAENVLDGKVVTYRVKRTCKRRLTNIPLTQKPHSDPNVKRPLLSLLKRFFVGIDGGDTRTDSLPFVPITTAPASTIENIGIRADPLIDEVTLRLVVVFAKLIHIT